MKIECLCQNPRCEKTFFISPARSASGRGHYCSRVCRTQAHMPVERICQNPLCGKTFTIVQSRARHGGGQYCSYPCFGRYIPFEKKLWARIAICTHGPLCPFCCFEWQGWCHPFGYGMIQKEIDGHWRKIRVHRYMWELVNNRSIPDGLWALHHCDNPSCVNIWHLYLGNHLQNMKDARVRGRLNKIDKARGETHGRAKFKATDIPVIRRMHAEGYSMREIGEFFGRSTSAINHILANRVWKHVP